ncbi:uncharacterized protein LOC106169092 [Lingula anatina]|uniref:Uncharacterized protein LOC106169092 n=1 Tax=Lingula anatina TaxID=7574 RepID=A0A1S3J243_LINAN|nr:uncharacterized protein LOC106169092 [Lingula anatina]|eukprot:XP_013403894.1 uncharacterized protein LOC106169092 [Lingula anatina]
MDSGMNSFLHLPSIKLGQKRIRCVCLCRNDKFHIDVQHAMTKGELLFLATDVLQVTGCEQPAKNFPRIHARYARNGLAAKVQLKGIRIHGWSSPVWCYSVQGLLKAVFEYQDKEIQKSCLQNFKDMWMQTIDLPPLPDSLILEYDKNYSNSSNRAYSDPNREVTSEPYKEHCNKASEVSGRTVDNDKDKYKDTDTMEKSPLEQVGKEDPGAETLRALSVVGRCLLHNKKLFKTNQQAFHMLDILSKVTQVLQHSRSNSNNEFDLSDGFPFHLVETYLNIIQDKCVSGKFQNKFSVPLHRNVALCVVAEWLGKEYYRLQNKICEEVDKFKMAHIDCIDNLPPPVKLVKSLFPQCMILLLQNWMAGSDPPKREQIQDQMVQCETAAKSKVSDQQNMSDSSEENFQTSSSPTEPHIKRRKCQEEYGQCRDSDRNEMSDSVNVDSAFPFIQLILEFTNKALISGVAHVVYSRMLHM